MPGFYVNPCATTLTLYRTTGLSHLVYRQTPIYICYRGIYVSLTNVRYSLPLVTVVPMNSLPDSVRYSRQSVIVTSLFAFAIISTATHITQTEWNRRYTQRKKLYYSHKLRNSVVSAEAIEECIDFMTRYCIQHSVREWKGKLVIDDCFIQLPVVNVLSRPRLIDRSGHRTQDNNKKKNKN